MLRVAAARRARWGLVTLLELPPKVHVAETIPDNERRHVLIVLDVSPSMRLKDAGPERRSEPDEAGVGRDGVVLPASPGRALPALSVVACYNGAKPVVVDTKDLEVVRNIFGDLPMHYAFPRRQDRPVLGADRGGEDRPALAAQEHAPAHAFRRRHRPGHRDAQDAGVDRRRA